MGEKYYQYWGKADKKGNYHLLPYHCLDVAAVAWYLLDPAFHRCKDLGTQTNLSSELIRYLIVFAFMLHDLGKFSLRFQGLVHELFQRLFPLCDPENYTERHDTMGYLIWREFVKDHISKKSNSLAELLDYFIRASFGHHGVPPKESARGGNQELRVDTFFRINEIECVKIYCSDCMSILGEPPTLPKEWKLYKKKLKIVSWNIAGLGVVSDWIGSDDKFFPFKNQPVPLHHYWESIALPQAMTALKQVGWKTHRATKYTGEKSFLSMFPFINAATPLQKHVALLPFINGPKLFILEDVTGAGKTEAALVLAARIMANGDADGLYIGLPTMATANAMYKRMQEPYRRLYRAGEKPSLILSHGKRHFSKEFTESVIAYKQSSNEITNEETASSSCNAWYGDNRKKALLADIGVGTIDQALLGVLPAKHQSLRLLGLQRKILIIDEVHAYDPYMEYLLEVLLDAHARGGGSAILLSATIPSKKKNDLIAAFRNGLSENCDEITSNNNNGFPLVTQAGLSDIKFYEIETRREVQRSVGVSFMHDFEKIIQFIEQKAAEGECVCWIRNTVKDARKAFGELKKRRNIPSDFLELFHSRFAMVDRARIETDAENNFGKKSGQNERKGRVLISTQVVEQSLDLDFDQMITDLTPIDLIIQRAGRLHRHIRDKHGNRLMNENAIDGRSSPVINIYAPLFVDEPDHKWLDGEFAGTLVIYRNPGRLWLTQKKLSEIKFWRMPEDARKLIEDVYGEEANVQIPEGLLAKTIRAEGEDQSKEAMGHFNALMLEKGYCRNAVKIDQWDEEEKVPTRLSEDNIEVVLSVFENDKLVPYANIKSNSWDWSCLAVSLNDWNKTGYEIPKEFSLLVKQTKEHIPRLKYTNFVIVRQQSDPAIESDRSISDIYSPRFGWGKSEVKEE